jgi:hypothetical protein
MNIARPCYLLPLRWAGDDDGRLASMTGYLAWLGTRCDVVVVDGSRQAVFDRHREAWDHLVVHGRPDDDVRCQNGKARGVLTGMRRIVGDVVIIADDDVRYDDESLESVLAGLADADVVVPQNVFVPAPWHARWDTARSLLNRAFGTDYPGTLAVRKAWYDKAGGYDGDVLFENLELIRTLRVAGADVRAARDIMVRRRPPTTRAFWEQRIRQAYDSLAQPTRLAAELAILPVGATMAAHRPRAAAAAALLTILAAETGRHRSGGTRVFPATAALWAPLWMLERGVCSWIAVGLRLGRGGIGYAGSRLVVAAHSERALRRRLATRRRAGRPAEPTLSR